ncbi:MAG: NPCBM/NEW2 domain-containing protein [Planctomycetota bacterium]|nr:NPCBM/NEW2 domain-containing protein [Planctomycetota bacterium]
MRTRAPVSAALGAALLVGSVPPGRADAHPQVGPPTFQVLLRDGSLADGRFESLDAEAGFLALGGRKLELADVVSVSGPAPAESPSGVALHLVGGDVIRGEVVGGDEAGETVVVRSVVLGEVPVFIDRVERLVFLDRVAPGQRADFAVPEDADEGEGLFVPARRGFDVIVGAVHRFAADGILFEARGDDEPRLRGFGELAGFALRGGEGPEEAPAWQLVTVSGDRVGVDWVGAGEEELTFVLESGVEVRLRATEVAALTPVGPRVRFLSDIEPTAVVERSSSGGGDAEALRPFRCDRSVIGGALRASGRGFGKGLGVHARSVLTFTVPEGVAALVGVVSLDDSVLALPVRGVVDVQVRIADSVVFEQRGLAAGASPVALGRLPAAPGQSVELVVDFGPGLDLGDRLDWLGVAFVR